MEEAYSTSSRAGVDPLVTHCGQPSIHLPKRQHPILRANLNYIAHTPQSRDCHFWRAIFQCADFLWKVSWASYLDEVFEGEGLAAPQRELPRLGPRNEAPPTGGPLHTQQERAMSKRRGARDSSIRKSTTAS